MNGESYDTSWIIYITTAMFLPAFPGRDFVARGLQSITNNQWSEEPLGWRATRRALDWRGHTQGWGDQKLGGLLCVLLRKKKERKKMLKFKLVTISFQICLLISMLKFHVIIHVSLQEFSNLASDWLAAYCQPIRCQVSKFLLINMSIS